MKATLKATLSRLTRSKGNNLPLNLLHVLNDGYQASFILLLPFIAKSQGLNLAKVGILGSALNVASLALALPAGYLAVKFGGIKTLLAALFVYSAALIGVGMFTHFLVLLVLFVIGGIGFGVFHPIAFALLAKYTSKETRGRIMGNFTAIGDVGRIAISAALSFVAVAIGWQHTAILYSLVAFVAFIIFLSLPKTHEIEKSEEAKSTPLSLIQIIRSKRYVLALSTGALDTFASASLFVFLPFLLLKRGVNPSFLGTFTAAFFVGNFFGKTLLGRFVDVIGNAKVFILSELLMALFIFLLANSPMAWLIVVCSVFLGVFTKGTVPVQQTLISESVEHHGNFEKAFGFSQFISGIAMTIAPITLGFISDRAGIVSAFNVMAIVALLAVIPAIGYFFAKPSTLPIKA